MKKKGALVRALSHVRPWDYDPGEAAVSAYAQPYSGIGISMRKCLILSMLTEARNSVVTA